MRKILAPVLNYAIDKAKRNKFVQNLFEAPFELDKFPRMTLHDLKVHLEKSGLEIISILPFTKEQHLRMLDEQIISQNRMHCPKAAVLDLCTPRVYVLARKPWKQNLTIKEHLHD